MATIEFRHDQLNPVLVGNGEGDAFQRFVADTLRREYPQLQLFQTGGKDGAIDFSETTGSYRVVGETKKIGDDDVLTSSQREWRLVNQRLHQHLANSAGPTKGQSQYRPWYCADPAIRKYLFCVSGRLANQSQRDLLQNEIKDALSELARTHAHLQHLGQIEVKVFDWSDFELRLAQQPHLKFRWFPRTRPSGLTPVDALPKGTGFRAHLHEDSLPYFSRAEFRESSEADRFRDEIQDERAILKLLTDSGRAGIVLTGSGGVGKTRLGLELGRMALADGWTVLAVGNKLRDDALQELVQGCPLDARVLLVFDYVETQRNFVELANELTDLSNQFGLQLHYVANCRSSYYHELEGAVDHVRVALVSPTASDPADWTHAYRRAVVRHILAHGVPQADQRHEDLCRHVPVFAVFLSYLVEKKHDPWLQELLQEQDFGQWIAKRIQQTLPGQKIDRELALLMGLFPASQGTLVEIQRQFGALVDRLAADEWISCLSDVDDHTWATAHDVFADRILLSYLERIGPTADMFVRELFDLAEEYGLLRSAFTAMQRIADQSVVSSMPWPQIIKQRLTENAQAWQTVRDQVVRTPLLSELQIIDLLGSNSPVWQKAETDTSLQNAVGWLARWASRDDNRSKLDMAQQATLTEWLTLAARHAFHSNYVLTYGMRWDCELVRAEALRWLHSRPDLFQTHFLLVAWLTAKLPSGDVRPFIAPWLTKYALVSQVSFVVEAWLKSTKASGIALVQEPILAWLVKYQDESKASHVYQSWLDAGGEKSLVRQPILAWLAKHQEDTTASHVYHSWLDAGGETSLVQEPLLAWLAKHQEESKASHVYHSWLAAGGEKSLVRKPILAWLAKHQEDSEAQYVYKSWLDAGGEKSLVQGPILAWLVKHQQESDASHVYQPWLDAGGEKSLVQDPILAWLVKHQQDSDASHVYKAWLDAGGEKGLVQDPIIAWLAQHQQDSDASHVYKAWLDAGGEKGLVQEPMLAWLKSHATDFNADFVFRAWLESGGEFSIIAQDASTWLHRYRDHHKAVFVTKFLAKQPNISTPVVADILFWCRTFPSDPDALWRMTHLRDKLFLVPLAADVVATAELLLEVHCGTTTAEQLDWISSYLINNRAIRTAELRSRVDAWVVRWLKHDGSFTKGPNTSVQRPAIVQRIADLLYAGKLDATADEQVLAKFFRWLNRWDAVNKSNVRELVNELSTAFPNAMIWNCVRFSGPTN